MLSFVYPVYNEIENLPRLLPVTRAIAEGLVAGYEVVLVNDGSTDGSGDLMDRLAAEHPEVRVCHHRRNRGLGAAIATGLARARGDLVLYMDSDFPVSPEEARWAIQQLQPDSDLLVGYRLGRAEGPRREVMSWTYNRLIRWAFGLRVRDVNFAFKLIRRRLLDRMRLRSEGSFIDAELLLEARRLGARIQEVGLHYHTRSAGVSTAASSRVVVRILGEMWRYARRWRAGTLGPAQVIINADDFGLCPAVNRGVVEAFERGVVRSASLLVGGEGFADAVALARSRPELDLGVHLALTEVSPAAPPREIPSLLDGAGHLPPTWSAFLRRYLRGAVRRADLARELRAQVQRTLETGLAISHLDSHQHLHMLPGILPIVVDLAREFGIPALRWPRQRRRQASPPLLRRAEERALAGLCRLRARQIRRDGLILPDDFRGFSEAGAWDERSLVRTLADVDSGLTEIGCHPGADDAIGARFRWGYRWERETSALTSPEVAAALEAHSVSLTTYREVAGRACAT